MTGLAIGWLTENNRLQISFLQSENRMLTDIEAAKNGIELSTVFMVFCRNVIPAFR